jgi:hypothetical protein
VATWDFYKETHTRLTLVNKNKLAGGLKMLDILIFSFIFLETNIFGKFRQGELNRIRA